PRLDIDTPQHCCQECFKDSNSPPTIGDNSGIMRCNDGCIPPS
ncbi:30387_t:CDS:2, partial [Racocetra persica]